MKSNDHFVGDFSTTVCLKTILDLTTSGANDFGVIAAVHTEWKPEQGPEEAEKAYTPSISGTSCSLPPSTHSIKSTHGTWHGRVLLNDDNFVWIKKKRLPWLRFGIGCCPGTMGCWP
jgi:hypothetical protein